MIRATLGEWRVVYPRCLVLLVVRRRLIPLGRYAASLGVASQFYFSGSNSKYLCSSFLRNLHPSLLNRQSGRNTYE
jgi:hypothetical protein